MSYLNNIKTKPQGSFFYNEAMRIVYKFETEAYVENGIVRWKSNDHIPPQEVLELWKYFNKEFNYDECLDISSKETTELLNKYRQNRIISEEERFEMQATFEKGEKIVDIITGETIEI